MAVGYGTQERRSVTGSVASIRPEEINQIVMANPMDALKGRLPGVDIAALSFEPGAATRVRIRGARSIRASNDPLIVVDGVPVSRDVRDIDARDIQSIEVLKDGSHARIHNITLGYSLPESMLGRIGSHRARLYVRAQDPYLFTRSDFVGWEPEGGFGSGNGSFTFSQIDSRSPAYRSFLFGLAVTF